MHYEDTERNQTVGEKLNTAGNKMIKIGLALTAIGVLGFFATDCSSGDHTSAPAANTGAPQAYHSTPAPGGTSFDTGPTPPDSAPPTPESTPSYHDIPPTYHDSKPSRHVSRPTYHPHRPAQQPPSAGCLIIPDSQKPSPKCLIIKAVKDNGGDVNEALFQPLDVVKGSDMCGMADDKEALFRSTFMLSTVLHNSGMPVEDAAKAAVEGVGNVFTEYCPEKLPQINKAATATESTKRDLKNLFPDFPDM